MLNFDEDRFLNIQSAAVAQAEPLDALTADLLSDGLQNVFFLGAGGAGVLMQPAAQYIQRESAFPVYLEKAAELTVVGAPNLGSDSLVVVPSLSGTTQEALAVLDFAHEHGATVLALTGNADSPVATRADHNITVPAADDTSSESYYLQSLLLAMSLVHHVTGDRLYGDVVGELSELPKSLIAAKKSFEPRAAELAERFKDVPYHIVTGAGPSWTEGWYYATCILEEMQWIRTRPVHAADFFHGTLELVEPDVSVVLLKGEGPTRALDERVERFVPTITDAFTVIDTAEHELAGMRDQTRSLVSHIVHATVLERLSAHLEVVRDHPLTTRRYYRRLDY